jgi:hypothetical protein
MDPSECLSAAFCNLGVDAREDLTRRYQDLMRHYGMTHTPNNRGLPREKGGIERPAEPRQFI